jgi:hypothetical protein
MVSMLQVQQLVYTNTDYCLVTALGSYPLPWILPLTNTLFPYQPFFMENVQVGRTVAGQ